MNYPVVSGWGIEKFPSAIIKCNTKGGIFNKLNLPL
ncbi:MAG: hypothetical protein UV02_C0001G0009 [Candidatus Kuenenbacteria bacterium GW2011_GWA2_42_15]|uniref:Uncharacterized protein n=1 Tax=Candidatus Kuenenbacteria bacterium GW2011_GWA2_42_15 TaxID=1618677 RepID=A0A0G0Z477_9BACT|nr:MAG: hypothetical protein UV02_C0001G0009 [Candidatus Kuenenbacteria bacterium GW2011_GWA2_42_15]